MQLSDTRPAREFARQFGVKSVIFGKPGSGKTPLCAKTAPKPLLLVSEPGMLTLRKDETPSYPAFTPAKLDDFFPWWLTSYEAKANFQTLVWDSASQGAESYLNEALGGSSKGGNKRHGQEAYGEMARRMMAHLTSLYFQPERHIVLICKLQRVEENDLLYSRPYFPGRELNVRVPHLYDLVMQLGDYNVPGVIPTPPETATKAFKCKESFDAMARDRSGNLGEYEPPNLTKIFAKCMA